jgi:hypothetical protein
LSKSYAKAQQQFTDITQRKFDQKFYTTNEGYDMDNLWTSHALYLTDEERSSNLDELNKIFYKEYVENNTFSNDFAVLSPSPLEHQINFNSRKYDSISDNSRATFGNPSKKLKRTNDSTSSFPRNPHSKSDTSLDSTSSHVQWENILPK